MFFSLEECFINAELESSYDNEWSESCHHFIDSQMLPFLKKYRCGLFLFSCMFLWGDLCLFACLGCVLGFFPPLP